MKTRLLLSFLLMSVLASAQTYTESILYDFGSTSVSDGSYPNGLVMDSKGNLYGTTQSGGGSTNCYYGCGIVYKFNPNGRPEETILHVFAGNSDGAYPYTGLTIDKAGNLYGTTSAGGISEYSGCGTIFKITSAGKYSQLYAFPEGNPGTKGCYPYGPVTLDSSGNLYGATQQGGSNSGYCIGEGTEGCGVIYKLSTKNKLTVLYEFSSITTGGYPSGNILRDGKGNLYGIGYYTGTLFEVSAEGTETVLYDFTSPVGTPVGPYLARNSSGNFYGELPNIQNAEAAGTWEVTESGHVETNYYFCDSCTDPNVYGWGQTGPVTFVAGILYGTAEYGGAYYSADPYSAGGGTVYEFNPATGANTVLYSFPTSGTNDGCGPIGGVIADSAGNLYGTTTGCGLYGKGTVFKLTKTN